jgi:hypothetical protein
MQVPEHMRQALYIIIDTVGYRMEAQYVKY